MLHLAAVVITLHIVNMAGVPAETLQDTQSEVARLLATASVQTRWVADGAQVTLILASYPMAVLRHEDDRVMGIALDVAESPSRVYLFTRAIAAAADAYDIAFHRPLAGVIAHEIGHILLGPRHGSVGIMRASWNRQDFLRAARGELLFSTAEGAQMRARVIALLRTHGATAPKSQALRTKQ
jgi:hypothetical protein